MPPHMSALKEEERQVKGSKTFVSCGLPRNKMCTQARAPIRRMHQLERVAARGENKAQCPPPPLAPAARGLTSSPNPCLPDQVLPFLPALLPWAKWGCGVYK